MPSIGSITISDGPLPTYEAFLNVIPATSTANDIWAISGSATKTVKVNKIWISGTRASASQQEIRALKRNTANSGGTPTTATAVSCDSTSPAATAVVTVYTAAATTGNLVGYFRVLKHNIPTAIATFADQNQYVLDFKDNPVVLRGVGELLALSYFSQALTSVTININVEWTEE